jgi:hypothetical protein
MIMSTTTITEPIFAISPGVKARVAGGFYLVTFIAGALALRPANGLTPNLIATAAYLGVTVLFYDLFKPVSRSISLLAAIFSLFGCIKGALDSFHIAPFKINNLVFFGFYCLLIGYLIFRSTFLPRILGVLMAFGGLGWLTFLFPTLARSLSPYNMAPGILGEGVLTLWLLVMGVNAQRWLEQARSGAKGLVQ